MSWTFWSWKKHSRRLTLTILGRSQLRSCSRRCRKRGSRVRSRRSKSLCKRSCLRSQRKIKNNRNRCWSGIVIFWQLQ
jgi:hypothetical protein